MLNLKVLKLDFQINSTVNIFNFDLKEACLELQTFQTEWLIDLNLEFMILFFNPCHIRERSQVNCPCKLRYRSEFVCGRLEIDRLFLHDGNRGYDRSLINIRAADRRRIYIHV